MRPPLHPLFRRFRTSNQAGWEETSCVSDLATRPCWRTNEALQTGEPAQVYREILSKIRTYTDARCVLDSLTLRRTSG